MTNTASGRPFIWETKTTTQGLNQYIQQCKPNNQITGYFKHGMTMFPEMREAVWDCIFVSSRRADMSKALADRHWMYGIDKDNDFRRQTTTRSERDVAEFMFDATAWAFEYCKWKLSGEWRWPRSAPGACHTYGGCQFRPICSVNGDNSYLETFFKIKKWEPHLKMKKLNG